VAPYCECCTDNVGSSGPGSSNASLSTAANGGDGVDDHARTGCAKACGV
jgi:hypothetical protein